jgi:hypothetical protein
MAAVRLKVDRFDDTSPPEEMMVAIGVHFKPKSL